MLSEKHYYWNNLEKDYEGLLRTTLQIKHDIFGIFCKVVLTKALLCVENLVLWMDFPFCLPQRCLHPPEKFQPTGTRQFYTPQVFGICRSSLSNLKLGIKWQSPSMHSDLEEVHCFATSKWNTIKSHRNCLTIADASK